MIQRLKARPIAKPEWGSTKLEPWFPNSDQKIGEVWFEGPGENPLLIKFLFTTAALSVQVHPNDEYALKHYDSIGSTPRGKTEMWHILAAEPGAQIAAGFVEQLTAEQMREAAVSGEIKRLLEWHDARPGDTFYIPAGTVHAIGPGLTLCEIQQASDITYRLFDYGRPRELHLDHAMRVSHLCPCVAREEAREGVLVQCPFFTTEKILVKGSGEVSSLNRDQSVIVIEGSGQLGGEQARAGEVFHISADEPTVTVHGDLTLLRTFA
jgi:mannose-6-phosphate isomerase